MKILNQQGLSLIEVLLMVAVIGLVAAALGQLSVVSVNTADVSRSRAVVNELARQALELARSERDTDQADFFEDTSGNYQYATGYYKVGPSHTPNKFISVGTILPSENPPPSDYQVSSDSTSSYQSFYRVVYIESAADQKTVTASVYYPIRGTYEKVVLQTILTSWR